MTDRDAASGFQSQGRLPLAAMVAPRARAPALGEMVAVDMDDCTLSAPTTRSAGGTGSSPRLDFRAVWQLSSMSLGIGIFAIPNAFLKIGWVHGSFWIVVLGLFAESAQQRLLDAAERTGVSSYEGLAERAFGPAGKLVMTLVTLLTTGIATLSYLGAAYSLLVGVVVAFFVGVDVNSAVGSVTVLSKAKEVIFLCLLCAAVLPRCVSRSMGAHAWISTCGVFAMCGSVALFVYSSMHVLAVGCGAKEACGQRAPALVGSPADALQYIATLAFSYSMCFALFPVLQDRVDGGDVAGGVARMRGAVRMSVLLSTCVYLLVGIGGVFAFGTRTKTLALENLPLSQPLTQIISFVVGVNTALIIAIISFPTVQALELLVGMCRTDGTVPESARPWLVGCLGLVCVLVDSFLPTSVAFALTGSLGLAMGAYIMPCLLFLKIDGPFGQRGSALPRAMSLLVLVFGSVLLFGSTPVTVWRTISTPSGAEPEALSDLICPSHPNHTALRWQTVV